MIWSPRWAGRSRNTEHRAGKAGGGVVWGQRAEQPGRGGEGGGGSRVRTGASLAEQTVPVSWGWGGGQCQLCLDQEGPLCLRSPHSQDTYREGLGQGEVLAPDTGLQLPGGRARASSASL